MSIAADTAASVTLAPTLVTASRIPRPGAAAVPNAVSFEIVLLRLMTISNDPHNIEITEIFLHYEVKEKLIIAMILIVLRCLCTVKQKREPCKVRTIRTTRGITCKVGVSPI